MPSTPLSRNRPLKGLPTYGRINNTRIEVTEMSDTRRNFFHSAAAFAAVLGAAANVAAQAPPPQAPAQGAGQGPGQGQGRGGRGQQSAGPPQPASEVQAPKMKFGKAEISQIGRAHV